MHGCYLPRYQLFILNFLQTAARPSESPPLSEFAIFSLPNGYHPTPVPPPKAVMLELPAARKPQVRANDYDF